MVRHGSYQGVVLIKDNQQHASALAVLRPTIRCTKGRRRQAVIARTKAPCLLLHALHPLIVVAEVASLKNNIVVVQVAVLKNNSLWSDDVHKNACRC